MTIAATPYRLVWAGVAALILWLPLVASPAHGQPNNPAPAPAQDPEEPDPAAEAATAAGAAIVAAVGETTTAQMATTEAVGDLTDAVHDMTARLHTIERQGDAQTDLLLIVGVFVVAAVLIRWFRQSFGAM